MKQIIFNKKTFNMKQLIFILSIMFSFALTGQRDSVNTYLRTYSNIDTVNLTPPYNKITTTYRSNAEGMVTMMDTIDMTISGRINQLIQEAQSDSIALFNNREGFYRTYQDASTKYLNNARYLQKLHLVKGTIVELPTVGVRGVAEGGTTGQVLSKSSGDDYDTEWVTPSGGGASYLVYTALLTQSGTDAPVAIVLENTFDGVPVWSYAGVGDYRVTLTGAFPQTKTALPTNGFIDVTGNFGANSVRLSDDEIVFNTGSINDSGADNILYYYYFEIRVYP